MTISFFTTKEEFCRFCRFLYDRHLVSGMGGNMSARDGINVFLPSSGTSLRVVDPDTVVKVNNSGEILEGGIPTKDAGMHISILRVKPSVHVIYHVHGAYILCATTMLMLGPETLPSLTPGFIYFAYLIPMITFLVLGTKTFAQRAITELLKKNCWAV